MWLMVLIVHNTKNNAAPSMTGVPSLEKSDFTPFNRRVVMVVITLENSPLQKSMCETMIEGR